MNGNDTTKILIGQSTVLIPADGDTPGRSVDVKEMRWPDALQFFRMLSEHVQNLVTMDASGRPVFDFARIKDAIPATGALAEFMIERTTGLTSAEMNKLSLTAFLEILAVTMELNLSEELVGKFNRVANVVKATFGERKTASPAPSTS